ncbi:MAG: lytic transglycosylase domain-containing protein [Bacillota bacterium]|nr:lytic transglycosylase domain-containing protein [Bacillota bacterium]
MIVLVNKKRFASTLSMLIVIVLALVGLLSIRSVRTAVYPRKYSRYVENYSRRFKLDKYLVYAVIKSESGFNEDAVSQRGAVGLMQIMPETAEEAANVIGIKNYDEEMLKTPKINIWIGCYYMDFLMKRYNNDIQTAMAAYNAGYGNVDVWMAQEQTENLKIVHIPFGETKKYVVKILGNYNSYKGIYGGKGD